MSADRERVTPHPGAFVVLNAAFALRLGPRASRPLERCLPFRRLGLPGRAQPPAAIFGTNVLAWLTPHAAHEADPERSAELGARKAHGLPQRASRSSEPAIAREAPALFSPRERAPSWGASSAPRVEVRPLQATPDAVTAPNANPSASVTPNERRALVFHERAPVTAHGRTAPPIAVHAEDSSDTGRASAAPSLLAFRAAPAPVSSAAGATTAASAHTPGALAFREPDAHAGIAELVRRELRRQLPAASRKPQPSASAPGVPAAPPPQRGALPATTDLQKRLDKLALEDGFRSGVVRR